MKILFYSCHAIWYEHLSILLDEAICRQKEGHEVYFVYNSCALGICTGNLSQDSYVCAKCCTWMHSALRLLPKSIHTINISEFWQNKKFTFQYESAQDIKRIEYRNVKVGYAVLSSYITKTRNLYPEINKESRAYFDKIINATCNLTDALARVIDSIQPDRMCFFNARFFEWRPPYDLAVSKGIEAVSYEKTPYVNGVRTVRFVNTTPHNVEGLQAKRDELWANAQLTEEEKIAIGEDFFFRRRNGADAGDKIYISNQTKGKMPDDWDDKKKNIVIFNSSEDEFAAIGDEFDRLALFPTQYRGIKFILESLKDKQDYHVYLRIHPNLSMVPYRYHTELLNLPKQYSNVTVIPGGDSISTYDLMDAAEKVVVFGSTMGLEAAYWNKPVILLAGANYYNSDLCYVPHSEGELAELLQRSLRPKKNANAVKWGFYMMYRNPDDRWKYVPPTAEVFRIGRIKWYVVHALKLFGSSRLYAILSHYRLWYSRHHSTQIDVPMKEDVTAEL